MLTASMQPRSGPSFAAQPASMTVMEMQRELLEAQSRTAKLAAAHEATVGALGRGGSSMPLRAIMPAHANTVTNMAVSSGRAGGAGFHEHIDNVRNRYALEVQNRMQRRPF